MTYLLLTCLVSLIVLAILYRGEVSSHYKTKQKLKVEQDKRVVTEKRLSKIRKHTFETKDSETITSFTKLLEERDMARNNKSNENAVITNEVSTPVDPYYPNAEDYEKLKAEISSLENLLKIERQYREASEHHFTLAKQRAERAESLLLSQKKIADQTNQNIQQDDIVKQYRIEKSRADKAEKQLQKEIQRTAQLAQDLQKEKQRADDANLKFRNEKRRADQAERQLYIERQRAEQAERDAAYWKSFEEKRKADQEAREAAKREAIRKEKEEAERLAAEQKAKQEEFERLRAIRNNRIRLNSHVDLLDRRTNKRRSIKIVPPENADIKYDRISISSPIAKALLYHIIGDVVEIKTPNGIQQLEIQDVI